ncbi:MAG: DUF559 domain-containing protein [Gemmatimonadetes bacterium]|nr:DUF559 domain-containing protein [Gemmatimonadota bacterium]
MGELASLVRKRQEPATATNFARGLRHRQTATEAAVWAVVRRKQLFGLEFRRQHPIAGLVVDFHCPALKLVIELEGGVHSKRAQITRDKERAEFLRGLGFRVIRLANEDATEESLRRLISELGPPLP